MQKVVLIVFGAILLLLACGTFVTTPLVLWMMPEIYAAEAQIAVADGSESRINTEMMRMRSSPVLQQAITNLNLTREWGMKYKSPDGALTMLQTETQLQSGLEVKRVPRTSVISIRFHSDSRDEAARVANEIARVYLRSGEPAVARILNPARPQAEPVRPNKRLGITVGVAVSAVLGAVGSFLIVLGFKRRAA